MAIGVTAVPLNKGLDTVSPPLTAEPGALLSCLNYEMTDTAGYRRIDGYERYDGFPNGALYEYYNVAITANDPGDQASIIPGSVISRTGVAAPTVDIGVVLSEGVLTEGLYYYDVVRIGDISRFTLVEEFLLLSDGESFMSLTDDTGLLKIAGAEGGLGDTFTVTTNGTAFTVTISSTPISGKELAASPQAYVDNIRTYSSVLRGLVQDTVAPVAGVYWFQDRLLVALNTMAIELSVVSTDPQPVEGALFRWNGTKYRLIHARLDSPGPSNGYTLHLAVVGDADTTDDDLVEINVDGTTVATWLADVTTADAADNTDSACAQIAYCNNSSVANTRGFTYLTPATDFDFDAGNYAGTLAPPLTLDDDSDPSDGYYVVGDAGATVFKVRLTQVVQTGGTFSAGDAIGSAQVVTLSSVSGDRDYLVDNDEIHSEYPTTGTSRVFTVNGTPTLACPAGTASLDDAGTKYVWDTMNFYGQVSTQAAYAATGASRALWANEHGYGSIKAVADEDLDTPKYLAFHVGKLALGYAQGSVLLSVIGEAYNFEGSQGAIEVTTGDNITGLLELAGDTLAVFGRRSIRKITGYTDADTQLGTISARANCFDYTACVIGQDAVFTGPNGITTLQQSQVYGNFVGQNISDPISNWLRPRLVTKPGFESGGVICAFPVRSKGQYRLVLITGDIVTATFTQEGPKLMISNWSLAGQARVPYAWSSEISDSGLERLHLVWSDSSLRTRIYEMDTGWGFDGRSFDHYFEIVHTFSQTGTSNIGVEKCRMYGQSYGLATLDIKSSGIEDDFLQPYHETVQDISMPATVELLYDNLQPSTSIIDQANWGLGVKLKIQGSNDENSTSTEPPHICQVLVLHMRTEGAQDG